MASASAVGETGVNIGLAFVTGGAGIAISVGGTTAPSARCCATRPRRSSSSLAAGNSPPWACRLERSMRSMPRQADTDRQGGDRGLADVAGAAGDREVFIARTAQAKTYTEGFAYRRKAELTAGFDKRVSPVKSFFNVNGTPVMQTGTGAVAGAHGLRLLEPWCRAARLQHRGQGQIWITGSAINLPPTLAAAVGRSCQRPAPGSRNTASASARRWRCPTGRCRPAST